MKETIELLSNTDKVKGLQPLAVLDNGEGASPMPSLEVLRQITDLCREIFFPGFYGTNHITRETLPLIMETHLEHLRYLLRTAGISKEVTKDFIQSLPAIRDILATDVEAAYNGDPAAESFGEIIACYPCIKAITNYRIAHQLLKMGVSLIPRIITEMAHSETGIDIHPGATIGHHFTIDHGTGVVIGATCIIGNNVKLYQGVTLGAKSFPLDENGNPIKGIPRHPIIEDDVIIYSNATVLGRITIARGTVIGGNLWVTESTEANAKLTAPMPSEKR